VFRIDLYTASACDQWGYGAAATYQGTAAVVTDIAGNAEFEIVVPTVLDSGFASATASRAIDLATSEFSPCVVLGDLLFTDGFDD
jgi:hypothetical protein